MSIIRSQPYSRQGRDNWDEIFGPKEPRKPSGYVQDIIEAVRDAGERDVVEELRKKLQDVTKDMVETDRIKAFRVFNANVPASVIPKE